ncbi:MAG: RNA-binding S4 domain-containing protein, partial [Usitatibacteraceae bacterium]
MGESDNHSVRIDKWLWAARFFKTRSLAVDAVNAGRVEVNGERVKPAKSIKCGDRLLVRKPPVEFQVLVKAIADKRGSAVIAQTLYEESPESVAAREKVSAELRA